MLQQYPKAADVPLDFINECKTLTEEDEEGTDGAWVSWKVASEKEGGDDVLQEMVSAGTVRARKNPKLPKDSKIPYPRNMQIAFVQEVWSSRKRIKKTTSTNAKSDKNKNEFDAEFARQNKAQGSHPIQPIVGEDGGQQLSAQHAKPEDPDEKKKKAGERPARDKVTVAGVRKAHNSCDREMRLVMAVLSNSKKNRRTRESQIETEVAEWLDAAKNMDDGLVALEQQFLQGVDYSDEDIEASITKSKAVVDFLKLGKKKTDALKQLLALDDVAKEVVGN